MVREGVSCPLPTTKIIFGAAPHRGICQVVLPIMIHLTLDRATAILEVSAGQIVRAVILYWIDDESQGPDPQAVVL